MYIFKYYYHIFKQLFMDRTPKTIDELNEWSILTPYFIWNKVCRYEGKTFCQYYLGELIQVAPISLVSKLRYFYLIFTLLWPFISMFLCLRHGKDFINQWMYSLKRTDLRVFFPKRHYNQNEVERIYPETLVGLYFANEYVLARPSYQSLDDKNLFAESCENHNLSVPRHYEYEEAIKLDQDFILKDPRDDMGRSIKIVSSKNLKQHPEYKNLLIQEQLTNHPDIAAFLPEVSALSTIRLITTQDPENNTYKVTLALLRMGRKNSVVDNYSQDGLASFIDLQSGKLSAAFNKKSQVPGGTIRLNSIHPDTDQTIEGIVVPFFEKSKSLCQKAHKLLAPDAVSIGWDIGITEDGPYFIELNFFCGALTMDNGVNNFYHVSNLILNKLQSQPKD